MASSAVAVSTGMTITFGTSGFAPQITDFSWDGISRPSIPTSHMGTATPGSGKLGNATFLPGKIIDPGSIQIEGHFNGDTIPPMKDAAETVTIAFPDSATKASWAGSAFMTDFQIGAPLDDKMTFTATVKFTGNITVTAGT